MTPFHDAAALVRSLRDAGLADDEQLIADMVEGSTSSFDVVDRIVASIGDDEAFVVALAERGKDITARKARLVVSMERKRQALAQWMQDCGLTTLPRPEATVSVAAGREDVVYPADLDPMTLPEAYRRTKVEVDRAAVRRDVLAGKDVPGVTRGNGAPSLRISRG